MVRILVAPAKTDCVKESHIFPGPYFLLNCSQGSVYEPACEHCGYTPSGLIWFEESLSVFLQDCDIVTGYEFPFVFKGRTKVFFPLPHMPSCVRSERGPEVQWDLVAFINKTNEFKVGQGYVVFPSTMNHVPF